MASTKAANTIPVGVVMAPLSTPRHTLPQHLAQQACLVIKAAIANAVPMQLIHSNWLVQCRQYSDAFTQMSHLMDAMCPAATLRPSSLSVACAMHLHQGPTANTQTHQTSPMTMATAWPSLTLPNLFRGLLEALLQLPNHLWLQQAAPGLLHVHLAFRILDDQIGSENLHSSIASSVKSDISPAEAWADWHWADGLRYGCNRV